MKLRVKNENKTSYLPTILIFLILYDEKLNRNQKLNTIVEISYIKIFHIILASITYKLTKQLGAI